MALINNLLVLLSSILAAPLAQAQQQGTQAPPIVFALLFSGIIITVLFCGIAAFRNSTR